jgi:magnesium-transporting ATPase (P-type)
VAVLGGYYIGAFTKVSDTMLPSMSIGQTMAFLICGWTSILHIFHVRSAKSVFKTPIRNNKSLAGSAALMILLFGVLVALPIGKIFGLTQIDSIHWLYVIALTMVPTIARELGRWIDDLPFLKERRRIRKELLMDVVHHRKPIRR